MCEKIIERRKIKLEKERERAKKLYYASGQREYKLTRYYANRYGIPMDIIEGESWNEKYQNVKRLVLVLKGMDDKEFEEYIEGTKLELEETI